MKSADDLAIKMSRMAGMDDDTLRCLERTEERKWNKNSTKLLSLTNTLKHWQVFKKPHNLSGPGPHFGWK